MRRPPGSSVLRDEPGCEVDLSDAAADGGAGRDGSLEPEREHRKVRLEEFESRIRALEGWRAEKVGEERRISTISAGARRRRGRGGCQGR